MKKLLYTLTVSLMVVVMLTAAACTSGGNVDDNDGKVSDTSSAMSNDDNTSSDGMLNDVVSDVESDLGIDGASSTHSGSDANSSK